MSVLTGYAWLRAHEQSGSLRTLLAAARAPWSFTDVVVVESAGEVDEGEGERRIVCIVRPACRRRYQLTAWRSADGTISHASCQQLPGPI